METEEDRSEDKLEDIFRKINLADRLERNVPLAGRTTFRVGGRAQRLFSPRSLSEAATVWKALKTSGIRPVILGKGANVLVSDAGISGLVLDMGYLDKIGLDGDLLVSESGAEASAVVEYAWDKGLSSLEFLYAMPSSLGGAVFMNARCYDHEVSEVLEKVLLVDEGGNLETLYRKDTTWAYKDSPFMHREVLILQAWFRTQAKPRDVLRAVMEAHKADRTEKGHFRAPCAGSYFKNNREFGAPTGVIVDRLGLKGLQLGGAQVAPWHGNILINTGNATAADIRNLGNLVKEKVRNATGFTLEEEVIFLGNW